MKRSGLSECRALVITAGYEPERFRSLFLHWTESAEAVTSVCKVCPVRATVTLFVNVAAINF